MRIISKFKDYYDSAMGYGIDTKLIYDRTTVVIPTKYRIGEYDNNVQIKLKRFNPDQFKIEIRDIEQFIVGFCGSIHYGFKTDILVKKTIYGGDYKTKYFYDEDVIKFIIKYQKNHYYSVKENDLLQILQELKNNNLLKNIFSKYNVANFVLDIGYLNKNKLILNPKLNDFQFYKIKNAYQTFQELSMFIGNDLASDTNVKINTGNDKDLAKSKGFNKFSFRKDKKKND